MNMIKKLIFLCFVTLPSLVTANDIDKVIFDIKKIIAEKRKVDIENIQIIKPDNRLKLSMCRKFVS